MYELMKKSNVNSIIDRDIKDNMLNHAYMFISSDEEYIKALALHIAKHIMCVKNSACNECSQCLKISKNEHADLVILPTSKKNIVVDDVENIVTESYVLPLEGDKKIYILNNFDQATVQAQNKLLKTLEEPPASVVFLITATNENNVLATIRSRCKKIFIPKINDDVLNGYIRAEYPNLNSIDRVVKIADGSLTTAIKFLNDADMFKIKDLCIEIVNVFDKSDKVLYYSSQIQNIDNFESFLNVLLDTFREVMEDVVMNDNSTYKISKYNTRSLLGIADIIQTSMMKFKANCNINAVIDYLLLGILEVRFKCQK